MRKSLYNSREILGGGVKLPPKISGTKEKGRIMLNV